MHTIYLLYLVECFKHAYNILVVSDGKVSIVKNVDFSINQTLEICIGTCSMHNIRLYCNILSNINVFSPV